MVDDTRSNDRGSGAATQPGPAPRPSPHSTAASTTVARVVRPRATAAI